METIRATIQKILYYKEASGYKVLSTRPLSGKSLTIVGEFGPEIIAETVADFHGDYKTHPKYGYQFKAQAYNIIHNAEELTSVKLFLVGIAPNIGTERASAIVDHFKMDTINVLDNNPERLLDVIGIGEVSAKSLTEAWKTNREKWDSERIVYSLRAFLGTIGLKERRVKKVLSFFGGHEFDAEQKIRDNPYRLIEIEGFGFTTVDFIARKLGISEESPERFQAFIVYCLDIICPSYGHLFFTIPEMNIAINEFCMENNTKFLGKDISSGDINDALVCLKEKVIVDEDKVYSKTQYDFERMSAVILDQMMKSESDLLTLNKEAVEKFIAEYERDENKILSQEQKTALYYFVEKKVFIITGAPGTGKCLGQDTPVMMFNGSIKKVQDIIKDDLLMGDDSTPRKVLSVCTGKDNLFKIIPIKGDSFIINSCHVLSLKSNSDRGLKKNDILDIPLNDYEKLPNHKKHHLKLYRVPIDFPEQKILINPYLIGYWLGNGSQDGTRIDCPFPEVINFISEIINPFNLIIKKYHPGKIDNRRGKDVGYNIRTKGSCHPGSNVFLNILKELNLINNKHIPDSYLFNNKQNRFLLLAGILDADGSKDISNIFDLTLENKSLLEQVIFLARSLGFSSYIHPARKKWTSPKYDNKYSGEKTYYRTSICGDLNLIPNIVKKKKNSERKQKKNVLLTGMKIESIGKGDYYGFTLDGNGRFLLGDFTVTHNTEILKAVVRLAHKTGLKLTCMTPTGISAKKLALTINEDAYTIHRRLGFRGESWGYNELNKYDTDVVIVDEASMVDQEVLYRMLSALRRRTHVIFVGDHNQLPSVGAGNVLRELIHCGAIPVVTLDKIFRQDEASDIIKAAHQIIHGDTSLNLFKNDPTADIFFMRIREIQEIEKIVIALANKFKNEKRLFQIITPRNTGPLGVDSLNQILQQALNPPGLEMAEIKLKTFTLRRGDRVLVKKNDYENNIYNGDVGKVISVIPSRVTLKIDETMVINIPIDEIEDKLKLAYSMTAHKTQGLEFPTVILLMINQHGKNLLQRNLLYTAITRAKTKVIVIGHGSAVERSINNTSVIKRNTKLGERLCSLQKKNLSSCTLPLEPVNCQAVPPEQEQFWSMIDKFSHMDIIEK
jgi:ATP-dependent exoDNAse (exonuclease V) alpha subunit